LVCIGLSFQHKLVSCSDLMGREQYKKFLGASITCADFRDSTVVSRFDKYDIRKQKKFSSYKEKHRMLPELL
jgi:hypothetical protein